MRNNRIIKKKWGIKEWGIKGRIKERMKNKRKEWGIRENNTK